MSRLTAVIHTKNSAATLAGCLRSVAFADQILVMDMASHDHTLEIARKFTPLILNHPDVGFVEPARAVALAKVKTEWTLVIDADEEVPPALQNFIEELLTQAAASDAYYLPRRNLVFHRWIEHSGWWPDYQLRLFRTGKVSWPDRIHAQPQIHGTAQFLPAEPQLALIHHNYQSIEQFLDRLNRYTSIEVDRGQTPTTAGADLPVLATTFSQEFVRRYFAEAGYRDRSHGIALAYLQSMYQVVVELKRWQKAGFPDQKNSQQHLRELRAAVRELQYWLATYTLQESTGLAKLWWWLRRKLGW